MNSFPIYLCLLVPMAAAAAQVLFLSHPRTQRVISVVSTLVITVLGFALVYSVKTDGIVVLDVGRWAAPVGIRLQADMLSALMIAITGIIGLCGAIHGLAEVPPSDERRGHHILYQFLLSAKFSVPSVP